MPKRKTQPRQSGEAVLNTANWGFVFFFCFLPAYSFLYHPHTVILDSHCVFGIVAARCLPRVWSLPSPRLGLLGCLCYSAISTAYVCKLLPFPSCWWALLSCCHRGTHAVITNKSFLTSFLKLGGRLHPRCCSSQNAGHACPQCFSWGMFWLECLPWAR